MLIMIKPTPVLSAPGFQVTTNAVQSATSLFLAHREELQWLSFLLTGDRQASDAVFTEILEAPAVTGAFRDFLLQWARRLVIAASLRRIRLDLRGWTNDADPLSGDLHLSPGSPPVTKAGIERALASMHPMPRCAFVLTALERIPPVEAANLLCVSRHRLRVATAFGMVQLTRFLQLEAGLL
jgi:DNA-directed RNA polymerase specialized sigma24 family protein